MAEVSCLDSLMLLTETSGVVMIDFGPREGKRTENSGTDRGNFRPIQFCAGMSFKVCIDGKA